MFGRINDSLDLYALNYYGTRITYRYLLDKIQVTAMAFENIGVKKGDIVTVISSNTPETIYCIYALNLIGAVVCMEYASESEQNVLFTIDNCKSKIVVILDILVERFKRIEEIEFINSVVVLPLTASMPKCRKLFLNSQIKKKEIKGSIEYYSLLKSNIEGKAFQNNNDGDTPAFIVHSGGTTGTPKSVVLSNNNVNSVVWQTARFSKKVKPGNVLMHSIPPFHAFGLVMGIHFPLCTKCELILMVKFDENTIAKLFKKHKPNHVILGSAQIGSIINNDIIRKMDLGFLKDFVIGGASVTESQEIELDGFLKEHNSSATPSVGYGMSELSSATCMKMNQINRKVGSTGIPFAKSNFKIINLDNGKECKYNETGELNISSPGLMLGYYENELETNDVIVQDENGVQWIKTGDLGYIDEDGYVFITGRLKRIYVTRDIETNTRYKVFPDYISNEIGKISVVQECAVICVPNKDLLNIPIAYIVKNCKMSDEEVEKMIIVQMVNTMARHLIPKEMFFRESLPHTSAGKIDYKLLEEMYLSK